MLTCIAWLVAAGSEDAKDEGAAVATAACDPDFTHVSCYRARIHSRADFHPIYAWPLRGFRLVNHLQLMIYLGMHMPRIQDYHRAKFVKHT